MKNFSILITILLTVFGFACSKQEQKETNKSLGPNSAQLISISGSKKVTYGITMSMGHSGAGCSGCVMSGGHLIHVDCQGTGNACQSSAIMVLSDLGEINFYYGTVGNPDELTDEDFFIMPNRSLYIIGSNGEFLNIPEQTVFRDEETGAFIFDDIFFSDYQAFENK